MPMLPPWPFFKMRGPAFYRMTCPACGFDETYELAKGYRVCNDPACDHTDDPAVVEALPAVCPKCGGRLKKEKLPIRIVR